MEPRYPFVAVDVPASDADERSAALFELGARGVELRDDQTLLRGPGDGRVTLVGSFETHDDANGAIASLAGEGFSPRLEEIVGDAWRDAWKAHFAPFSLTSRITVVPPWVKYEKARRDEIVLELEPGRAFGTGLHATTSLVAGFLDRHADGVEGREVLDVGTGSGILALAALLYGAARVVAIDVDADCLPVVRENAERNGLAARVDASAARIEDVAGAYPWVLANIEAKVLDPMAPELVRRVAPRGFLVLSGILASERDRIVERYTTLERELSLVSVEAKGDAAGDAWISLAFLAPT